MPKDPNHRTPRTGDLVYFQSSPDFCNTNTTYTDNMRHRVCDPTLSSGQGSCSLLCCGRGARKITETKQTKCNCVFKWCCKVVCQMCEVQETKYVCRQIKVIWKLIHNICGVSPCKISKSSYSNQNLIHKSTKLRSPRISFSSLHLSNHFVHF